ncbi:hypothetical protein [Falsiroseomonas tokyonensis]|uniref:Uncharacterized protein n=1 Tax=Falsiroseomonas tokyonensis TaxID=430521 RepID=A0ABV7BNH0_9PROT|nr:hypothetical protein [Falsiroseomonas tokyonensis]MBU8537138.1 hypothetical protein [Falsiroseomonas tokyonensis]
MRHFLNEVAVMWVWVVIAALFLFLLGRFLQENAATTRSRPAALIGTLADGAALVALTLGVFGLLVALVLGVFSGHGPRLAGESLNATLIWSGALIGAGLLLLLASGGIRRLGGRGAPAPAMRAGH